jgi:hypothetical protein
MRKVVSRMADQVLLQTGVSLKELFQRGQSNAQRAPIRKSFPSDRDALYGAPSELPGWSTTEQPVYILGEGGVSGSNPGTVSSGRFAAQLLHDL